MVLSAEIQRPFFSDLLGARPGASARPGLEKRELRVARAQRTHGLRARAAQAAWSQRSGGRQRRFRLPGGKLTTPLPRTEACDSDSDPEAWRPAPPGRGRRSSGVASASFRVGRSLFSASRLSGEGVPAQVTVDALPLAGEPSRSQEWPERPGSRRGSEALARGLSRRWPRAFRQPGNRQLGFWACAEPARSGRSASTPVRPGLVPDSAPSWG
ncbi:unnamed protein product [Rangifer tarandus platyrhynchus]|uniref:Uncharacterized protein n=2 Tax=Rangifer tarandus platyrhynchus TaxID=3082113 RepID=A0ACB0EKA4_RANTA|nr:unnamed protein product [Rangifer tarandus platyrhynchus]CAI9700536.1 unnamed protein product [Rangifer tarandus platyrhynchus]